MRNAKMKKPEFQCSTSRNLDALAKAISVRTHMDAKVVDLFHQAAVMAETMH